METVHSIPTHSISLTKKETEKIIAKSVAKASAIAALPIPIIDVAGVTYIQVDMVNNLANIYGVKAQDNTKLVVAALASALIAKLTSEALSTMTVNTKIEKIIGESLIKASVTSMLTTLTGEVYARHFDKGGVFENLTVSSYTTYIKEQIQSDRLSIANVGQSAITSIIDNISA